MQYQQHQQQQPPPPPPQQQHFMPQQPLLSGFPVPLTPNYPMQMARQPTPTRTTGVTSFNQHQSTPGSGGSGDTGPPLVVFPPSTDRLSVGNDADDDQSIPSLQSLPSDESPKQTQSECVHESMWDYFKECLSWEGQSFHPPIAFSVTYSTTYMCSCLVSTTNAAPVLQNRLCSKPVPPTSTVSNICSMFATVFFHHFCSTPHLQVLRPT